MQLRWRHQFQFAGYYAAVAKGYYAEEGLDVVLREKAPGVTPASEVTSVKKKILTAEEKSWLEEHPTLRMGIDPGWIPIEFINSAGEYSGLAADLAGRAEKELGIDILHRETGSWAESVAAAKAGELDIFPAMVNLPERRDFFAFTKPYIDIPVVILTRRNAPYIVGLDDMAGKRVAVLKEFSLTTRLKNDYPHYNFIAFPDTMAALRALVEGEVDAFPVNTASAGYALKLKEFRELHVAAPTPYNFPLSFGVRKDWPELVAILNKFIDSMSVEERRAMAQGWFNMQVEQEVDWGTVGGIAAGVSGLGGLVILVFVLWNRRLRQEVVRRMEAEDELQQYRRHLERLVEERTADLAASNEQLKASERKFKGIFHNSFQTIALLDRHGLLLECNDSSLALIDREAAEVVGQPFWQTPWWQHSPQLQEDLQGYISQAASGAPVNVDLVQRYLGGRPRYINFSLKPIFDEQGEVIFLVAEGRDISHQKLSELRYRTLFDSATDAILIMNEDRFVDCNARALEMYGCQKSQLVNASPVRFSPPLQPDGKSSAASVQEKIRAAYEGRRPTFEWQHQRLDGSLFDAEVSLNVAELEGERYLQAIVRDITARKNAEKQLSRLASVVEQAAEAIIITDPEGIIEYVNPAFEQISGYSRAEAVGQTPRLLRSGEHDNAFYKDLWQTITAGRTWKGRFVNRTKQGSLITEDATVSPVLDGAGNNVGYVSVARDITGHMKLEDDLRQAQKMEAIGTLAGGIAHDFNNILTSIFGYAELAMLHAAEEEKLHDDLGQVRHAAERARSLVQQILTFSRKTDQQKRPLRVALVAKEAIKLLRASIPSTIDIRQQITAGEQSVLADPTQIHQILMNLGTNAFHAMRQGDGVLSFLIQEVSLGKEDGYLGGDLPPGNYLEIEVSDTGAGMDAQTREKIFEPYFTTKKAGEGTGLGLAVVHGIVRDLQGGIHVYSEPGQGTTFRIYLPVVETKNQAVSQEPASMTGNGGHEHILFVDDEMPILRVAQDVFTAYGYQVTICADPLEALALFTEHPETYDLLITDMTMPGMNGLELADRVLAVNADLPVVLCTGYSELINKEKALARGIREYVSKPMVMSKLVAMVKRILSESRT